MTLLYEDHLPGGAHWSFRIKRGAVLRLIDEAGGGNVGMLLHNPRNLLERYNAPDTLKCQHTFKLTAGHCLYSDMGRIFCSIVADSLGWHDTVGGNLSDQGLAAKWTRRGYQQARNDWTLSGEHSFLVELAKYGMNQRDLAANLNWFSKVAVDEAGNLRFDAAHGKPGATLDLRFEMDTLVLLHTCPHPLNPAPDYPKKPLRYQFHTAPPAAADDPCRNSCPENRRGFSNTALYNELHA